METTRPTVARSRIAWRCTFLACLLTASFAAAAHLPAIANAPTSAAAGVLVRTAQDLTLAVIEANARLAGAEPVDRGRRLDALVAAARERQDALLALLDADPEEALRVVLPADLRSRMPAQATSYLEQNVEEDGAVDVYHVDHADAALDRYVYVLNSPRSGKLTLRFARNAPALRSGNQVHVSGVRIGDTLLAASGGFVTSTKAARTTSTQQSTLGAQKVLTILVNFTDDASQPFTVASAQSMMFNTVSNYWYEASYQQTTLAGDVAGWYTIPLSTTGCDYNSIASYAQSAASKAGYVLSHYTRFLYVFPGSTCSWWGMSQIGGNPSQSWIAAQSGFSLVVIGHELGHALGLYHSHSLDCGNVELAASGCTESEYGDLFDIMGGPGGKTPHYNAFQKEQLGWLNAGSSPPITTVPVQEGSADYAIGPLEAAADATPRALKIARPAACGATADYLYVEARQAIGFDAFLSGNANVLSGVLVHDATPGNLNSSHLLDMTPATTSWTDPALDAGVTFVDSASGMTMTPLSAGGSATTINLAFPATSCVHAAPGITLAPGDTQYSTAGSTTTYSVSVTNNDTCGCAASTFDVSASVPTGWTAGLARTGSIAPGTSGSVAFTITSAASAIAAFYAIPSTAANTAAPNFAGQTDATIAVIDGLAVSTTSDKTAYVRPAKRNQSVYAMITSSVTAAGTMVSGATVSVTVISPGGGSTTLSGTTGSDGLMYASYAIKSSSPPGVYSVTSIATLGQVSNTGTTTFTIQ